MDRALAVGSAAVFCESAFGDRLSAVGGLGGAAGARRAVVAIWMAWRRSPARLRSM
jgi:hypothetical protein